MKYFFLLTAILALGLGLPTARVEKRSSCGVEGKAGADNVPGATIDGGRATANQGYVFAQEGRNSIAVIRVGGRGRARLQTGTLTCVSPDKSACDGFVIGNKTAAMCKGTERCHFIGILGGVRAP